MIQEEVRYETAISLGFKRKEMDDDVFFNQYGFNWFLLRRKISKGSILEWCCVKRTVELVVYKKSDVQLRVKIKNKEQLEQIINGLKK